MPFTATSSALYINSRMAPGVSTQPAGLENTRPLSCASETWMGTLLLQHHTPYQPLTEEPGLLKSCLDATLTPAAGGFRGVPPFPGAKHQHLKALGHRDGYALVTSNVRAARGGNSSLLSWLRSMAGSRSVDFHRSHPTSDT